eukprot:3265574-Alexandrium_andersonii.AAC.1
MPIAKGQACSRQSVAAGRGSWRFVPHARQFVGPSRCRGPKPRPWAVDHECVQGRGNGLDRHRGRKFRRGRRGRKPGR